MILFCGLYGKWNREILRFFKRTFKVDWFSAFSFLFL
jgi:hypothetical protein